MEPARVGSLLPREPAGVAAVLGEELASSPIQGVTSTSAHWRSGGEGRGGVLWQLESFLGSRQLLGPSWPERGVRAAAAWGCSGRGRKSWEIGSELVRLVPVDNVSKLLLK